MNVQYLCDNCSAVYPVDTKQYRCDCGGLFRLKHNAPDFTPDRIDRSVWSIFRYRNFFPLSGDSWKDVSLGEGMTSTVPLDEDLLLKLDYAMPTLSFKDRGAALVIWLCRSLGIERVIQDSSGNAGNSIAAYAARAGIECEIFVPEGTSPKKIRMIESHGAAVTVVDGSRDDTAHACREEAERNGVFYASHVYNPFFYEGTKTYIYEVYEQLGRIPDNLFIPLGNGTLFLGTMIGLNEMLRGGVITRMPRIYAVQSENCSPFYNARKQKSTSVHKVEALPTLAEGIAIGEPMRAGWIMELICEHDVTILTAPEKGILPARKKLAGYGFFVEHTTAATLAAYAEIFDSGELEGESLISLCGAGLKSEKG